MSIYLAASSTNPASAHPLFKQREIDGLTHASVNQLCIAGRPFLRELAYDGYYRNIDVFLASTNRQKRIPTHIEDAELAMANIVEMIPFENPPVFILPIHELSPDQQETFMLKLRDNDPVKKVQGKTVAFILHKPNIRKAMTYLRICKDAPICPDGVWSPQMYASASILITIITEFLKTNTYPAFINEHNRGDFDGGDFIMQNRDLGEYDTIKIDESFKRARIETTEGEEAVRVEDEDAEMEDDAREYAFSTLRSAVLIAKPSPVPLGFNLGSPSEVPTGPGRVFPYFDRMIIPDAQTIRNIVSSFFLRNLGRTREEQVTTFKLLRPGWEKVAKTPQGGILTHMLVGIRIALETQTRMFAVYREGSYAGFVLLGAMWSVAVDNRMYEWGSSEEVKNEVAKMSSHEYALKIICEKLSGCSIVAAGLEGKAEAIGPGDVPSAITLWNAIKQRKLTVGAEEDIKKVLGLVAYQRSYREINCASLCWLFGEVGKADDTPLPDESPLYLPPTFSLYHDRLFQLLCTFGPDAPSMYNTSGQTYIVPKTSLGDANNVMDGKGKKALPRLLVSAKSVQVAYQDLKKVLRERAIKMDLGERAGRNRNVTLFGDQRDQVYEELRECLNIYEKSGDKRKGSGDVPDPKGKRAIIGSAADLLNLF